MGRDLTAKQLSIFAIFLFLPILAAAEGVSVSTAVPSRQTTLILGKVTLEPKKHYKKYKKMADYAASRLGEVGIKYGTVIFAKSNKEMIQLLKEGRIDWVTDSPFSALLFCEKGDAEVFLRKWKKGEAMYRSVIFVHKGGNVRALKDLAGKTFAMEDPGSASSFFIPLAMVKQAGIATIELPSFREKPPTGTMGYIFADDELSVATWVFKGLTDAGAVSDERWRSKKDIPLNFKNDMEIIAQSEEFPRSIEVVRKNLDPNLKEKLKKVLLEAHEDPEGQEALRSYDKTAKFDEFTGKAKEGLDRVKAMMQIIRKELE